MNSPLGRPMVRMMMIPLEKLGMRMTLKDRKGKMKKMHDLTCRTYKGFYFQTDTNTFISSSSNQFKNSFPNISLHLDFIRAAGHIESTT